jgi:hypothetical protein
MHVHVTKIRHGAISIILITTFKFGDYHNLLSQLVICYSIIFAGSKGKKESRPSRSGKEGASNDDESPSHKIAPIINKLNENRSKLMTMFSELDKYKCGKVNYWEELGPKKIQLL